MKKLTRYATHKSTISLADERIAELEKQNKALIALGEDFANKLVARLDLSADVMKTKNVRRQAKDMIVKHVPGIEAVLNNMFQNLDKGMQEQFNAIRNELFKDDKAFTKALQQYMKGHDVKEVNQFVAQISQLIPKQNENRKAEIKNQDSARTEAQSSLSNVFVRAYLAVVHFFAATFSKNYATVDQAVEQLKGKKAHFSRGYTHVSEAEKTKAKGGKKFSAKGFGKTKRSLQDRTFEMMRNAEELKKANEKDAEEKVEPSK